MFCIQEFAKYVLFIFNFLMSACAMVLIVFGIIYFMEEEDEVRIFQDLGGFLSLGIIAIIIGVIVLFIAAFGCCGALHQNTCLLTFYGIVLLILFIIQLTLGIFVVLRIFNEDDFFKYIRDVLYDIFNEKSASTTKFFYKLQTEFKCCGVANSSDYHPPEDPDSYPSSCCGRTLCYTPYERGCADAFAAAFRQYISIIGYVSLGFAVVEFLGAAFAFVLRWENNNSKLKIAEHKVDSSYI